MGFWSLAGQGMWPAFADRLYPRYCRTCAIMRDCPARHGREPRAWPDTIADHRPARVLADGGGHLGEHDPLDADHPGRSRSGLSTVHASTADRSARALPGQRRSDAYARHLMALHAADPDVGCRRFPTPAQQSNADQQMSFRKRWSSSTSSRMASGSWSRCHWHSSRPAASLSPSGAEARAALIA
jgi:hypothetical protein